MTVKQKGICIFQKKYAYVPQKPPVKWLRKRKMLRQHTTSQKRLPNRRCVLQLELAMIRERVRSGIENTRSKVQQIGRPQVCKEDIPAIFLRHYPAYKSKQLNMSELARGCDISRTTVYKYINLLES